MDVAETAEKKGAFIAALAQTCNITRACEISGLPRPTAYRIRAADPDFADEWENAMRIGADALEDECKRRAYEGQERQIFKDGKLVATTREYSDTLAIFLLKGANPEKFRERTSAEISGPGGKPIELDDKTAGDKLAAILAGIEKRASDEPLA